MLTNLYREFSDEHSKNTQRMLLDIKGLKNIVQQRTISLKHFIRFANDLAQFPKAP